MKHRRTSPEHGATSRPQEFHEPSMRATMKSTLPALRPTHSALRIAASLAAATLVACGGGGGGGGGGPQPSVTSVNINPPGDNLQSLVVTVTGTNLDAGLAVTSAQCTLSPTTIPASTASNRYYSCRHTGTAPSTVNVNLARSSDNVALGSASFALGAPTTVTQALAGEGATASQAGTAKYSRAVTVTVTGTNVNQGLEVASGTCGGMALSVEPPLVSTASTAYYRCRATSANGLASVTVSALSNPTTPLATAAFFVDPIPQVTLTMKLDTVPLGSVLIDLDPNLTPITVDNFLEYVNAGFYNGTIFHDNIPVTRTGGTPDPFVLQGGGYGPTSGLPIPTPKPTNPPIALETGAGLSNAQWTVALAREAGVANSGRSQFFINLGSNADFLDPIPGAPDTGYAVFGTISSLASRAVVDAMRASACTAVGDFVCLPTPNLIIESAVQTR